MFFLKVNNTIFVLLVTVKTKISLKKFSDEKLKFFNFVIDYEIPFVFVRYFSIIL